MYKLDPLDIAKGVLLVNLIMIMIEIMIMIMIMIMSMIMMRMTMAMSQATVATVSLPWVVLAVTETTITVAWSR